LVLSISFGDTDVPKLPAKFSFLWSNKSCLRKDVATGILFSLIKLWNFEHDLFDQPEPPIIKRGFFDAVLIAVSHEEFISQGLATVKSYGKKDSVIFDLRGAFKNLDNDDGIILL
jgi:hypothetical protein